MRVVAICLDTIGDLVLREPLFRALLTAGHEVDVAVRDVFSDVLPRISPRLMAIKTRLHPYLFSDEWIDLADLAEAVRAREPDLLIFPTFNRTPLESVLRGLLASVPAATYSDECAKTSVLAKRARAAGLPVGAIGWERLIQVDEDLPEWQKHIAFAKEAFALSLDMAKERPQMLPQPEDIEAARKVLRRLKLAEDRFVLCAPLAATSVPHKALQRPMIEAAASVLAQEGLRLLCTGTAAEAEGSRSLVAGLEGVVCWFGGANTLGTLIGLVASSRLYFGADTGPMHLAAALGRPVGAVFGGGHWPRFLPAAERGFAVTNFVPCFGCGWDCIFEAPTCVTGIAPQRIASNLRSLLGNRPGFWTDLGDRRARRPTEFERVLMTRARTVGSEVAKVREWAARTDGLLIEARREAASARQWATAADAERESLKAAVTELRAWAEKAEAESAKSRELAANNRSWAERTEELLAEVRREALEAAEWARSADEMRERERATIEELQQWAECAERRVAELSALSEANRAWAERNEAGLIELKRQADESTAWAKRADRQHEIDLETLTVQRQWADDAERRFADAKALADENREWAQRTEALLAEARREAQAVSEWARMADARHAQNQGVIGELQRWAEDAERRAADAKGLADQNREWAQRAEALLAEARREAQAVSEWARMADRRHAQDQGVLEELRRLNEDAERRVAAAQALAHDNRSWAERLESQRALALTEAEQARAWARRSDEQVERGKALQADLATWAERAERMLATVRSQSEAYLAWAQRADVEVERLAAVAKDLDLKVAAMSGELQAAEHAIARKRERIAALEDEIEPLRQFARTYRWVYSLHHGKRRH
jgi:ADP-heptose:LPS heptosyltransferase